MLWICKTPQRRQQWEALTTKQVQYDVDTRWNATYIMLGDAIRCKAELVRLIRLFPRELELYSLDTTDWMFVQQLFDVLKPFNEFCKLVSSGRPTITTSTGIYFHLAKHLKMAGAREGIYANYDVLITNAVYGSLQLFNKYYSAMDQSIIYYVASVLDPRIKGLWIRKEHSNGDTKLIEVRRIINERYPSMPVVDELATAVDNTSTRSFLQEMLYEIHQDQTFTSDVDLYFSTPVVSISSNNADPDWVLNWWRTHEAEYPIMSQVARAYLPIQAAEVDVERLFSSGRDLIGMRRHALKIETMRALMMLRNLQYK